MSLEQEIKEILEDELKQIKNDLTILDNKINEIQLRAGPPGLQGEKGESGKDGKDGKSPDINRIIREVVSLIPTPKDGKDGKDGESIIGLPGRDGTNGLNGKSFELTGEIIEEFINKILVKIPKPRQMNFG